MTDEAAAPGNVGVKRAYDRPASEDGMRILVDRLWPRGLSKEAAAISLWLKDLAPSNELRKWFGHDPARWEEFRRRYAEELRQRADGLEEIRRFAGQGRITLVYAAHDEAHNNAVALREMLAGLG